MNKMRVFAVITFLFVLISMITLVLPCQAEQLRYSNQPDLQIPFALENEDLDTFLKLNEESMKILVQEGRVILLEPGTKYTLIESGFLSLASKVMITSGALKGQKGYVPSSARDVMSELTR